MVYIVYHCYLVGNWREIVTQQLLRLKNSGLYDKSDGIFVTVNLSDNTKLDFENIIKDYPKLDIEYFIENFAEYPAIKKVRELGFSGDHKIFYFHAKGVSNTYTSYNKSDINEIKIKNISGWKECLEYFLIDNWEKSVDLLDTYDNVGVTCNNGWYWGNFWWSQSKHIRKTKEVSIGSRWDYEAWLNENVQSTNYEWFKFTFNPYLSYLSEEIYKNQSKYTGQRINLISAKYGTAPFEIDEGYSMTKLNIVSDVYDHVYSYIKMTDFMEFDFNVTNENLGGDPVYMSRKFLFVEFSPENDPEKVFKLSINEGLPFKFKF